MQLNILLLLNLLLAVFTSGGLLGEQSAGACNWSFLAVVYAAISGKSMRFTLGSFGAFCAIVVATQVFY